MNSNSGDPPLSDLYPSAAPAKSAKYNGSSGQAQSYFQHDFPAAHQQNYRVYVAGPNATPPTPPKHIPASAAPPPPPPPPKPPRSGSGTWMSDPSRTQYPSYSLSDENLYMNGGPVGLMKLPPESSPIYSNRQEIINAQTYQHSG